MSNYKATVGAKKQGALQLRPRKKLYGKYYCGNASIIDIRTIAMAQIP